MKEKLVVTSLILCLSACNDSEDKKVIPTEPTTPEITELVTELDEKFLLQIKKTMDVVETEKLWQGYDYKSIPQYFIRRGNKKAITAFVINPQSTIDKAQKLGGNESQGLNVVKFEGSMHAGLDELKAGNDLYAFDFKIDNKDYYIQAFNESEVSIEHAMLTGAFTLAVHEVFHQYQGKNFQNPAHYVQLTFNNFDDYPLGSDLLSLQVMSMELMKEFPVKDISKADAKEALKKYFVINKEMLKLDTTAHSGYQAGWIYKHGLGQELYEGSAQYIDQMVTRKILKISNHNKFIFHSPFEMDKVSEGYATLMTKKNVIDYFAFQVFYYTGANAVWLLNKSGYDIKNLEKGLYPYEAAKEFLAMTEVEEMELLVKVKQDSRWVKAEAAGLRYSLLK